MSNKINISALKEDLLFACQSYQDDYFLIPNFHHGFVEGFKDLVTSIEGKDTLDLVRLLIITYAFQEALRTKRISGFERHLNFVLKLHAVEYPGNHYANQDSVKSRVLACYYDTYTRFLNWFKKDDFALHTEIKTIAKFDRLNWVSFESTINTRSGVRTNKELFIDALKQYGTDRTSEEERKKGTHRVTFFCLNFGYSVDEKDWAVRAVLTAIETNNLAHIKPHLGALKNGLLGQIINQYLKKEGLEDISALISKYANEQPEENVSSAFSDTW